MYFSITFVVPVRYKEPQDSLDFESFSPAQTKSSNRNKLSTLKLSNSNSHTLFLNVANYQNYCKPLSEIRNQHHVSGPHLLLSGGEICLLGEVDLQEACQV